MHADLKNLEELCAHRFQKFINFRKFKCIGSSWMHTIEVVKFTVNHRLHTSYCLSRLEYCTACYYCCYCVMYGIYFAKVINFGMNI